MNVIMTHTFIKNFKKDFRKYWFLISDLALELKNQKYLKLKHPIYKSKFKFNKIAVRWIIYFENEWSVIPIFFVLKKDKKNGNNLVLDKETLEKINILLWKMKEDIENKNYIEY